MNFVKKISDLIKDLKTIVKRHNEKTIDHAKPHTKHQKYKDINAHCKYSCIYIFMVSSQMPTI